jgi:hypothetical protein
MGFTSLRKLISTGVIRQLGDTLFFNILIANSYIKVCKYVEIVYKEERFKFYYDLDLDHQNS